ncbi:ROK family transcriptional regulator [Peribacillus frigoritolerans]|uniref:ROK family transcriptional regulator n=1 Tax=Peribacillus frigoritolerans TaxID=450367 RepID=A0AAJ1QR35_9BACI|nr:ROK family transcriptional regulator [Peribacillus frigoritolerans]MDM5285529.1 ROK family transcriptional regulator [Peribacillus frigoritolerans]
MGKDLLRGSFKLMKSINRSLILNIIREKGPISRADIAKLTKLTPPTVSSFVKELLEAEIVIERNLGESSGGRKPTLLTLSEDMFHVIGMDVGSQNIKTILTSITGKVIKKSIVPLPAQTTNETLLSLMIDSVSGILDHTKIDEEKIVGIGVGMHGIVDVEEGSSVFAPNLNLQDIPIKRVLEERFNMMVKVENDGRAMSLGELWFGNGAGIDSFVCINVGRGIGAGIIINGKLYHGSHFISGEIGHMIIDIDGPQCTCGNYGCLQTFASGPSIVEWVKKEMRLGHSSLLTTLTKGDLEKVTGELIYSSALEGDTLCKTALQQAGRYLGVGITNVIHTVNPRRIIIGGGVSNAGDLIMDNIIQTVNQRALTNPAKQTEIILSKFGDDATAMGAVALILAELFTSRNTESAVAH